jgi:glycosyltransferase involved in cell wall biosynthesis
MPKVSIGLPVYNGQNFLAKTLEALLAQTEVDFEIVVSDNCSRDTTPQIVQEFAAKDLRVKYFRTDRVLPPSENHTRTFKLSSGKYFKWAAHDDLHAPEFLERCVGVLERDSSVVLVYPKVVVIDSHDRQLHEYKYKLRTDAPNPSTRFGALVNVNHRIHGAYEIYGLMRSDAVRAIPPEGNYPRGDSVFLTRMALLGRFHELPQVLFYSRQHETRSVRQLPGQMKSGRARLHKYIGTGPVPPLEWWDPSKKGVIDFPEWRIAKEYLLSIRDAPISTWEKFKCLLQMARWLIKKGFLKLIRDLLLATEQFVVRTPKITKPTPAQ